jgi:hypothetical protein
MKNQIMQNLKAIVLGLIIAVGASYALAWTPPASEPTGGNVAAPINVGGGVTGSIYTQTKSGILNLAHLFTSDLNVLNSDGTIPTVSASSVLVADTTTPGKVKWGTMSGGTSSGINAYGATSNTVIFGRYTTWTDIGLNITLTPSSASSKFLINSNVIATNGNAGGTCQVGLFRNATPILAPYSDSEAGTWDAAQTSATYLDTPNTTSPITYKAMIKGSSTNGDYCYINRSPGSATYVGISTMSIIEVR